MKRSCLVQLLILMYTVMPFRAAAADLPAPDKGGPNGKPISILVIGDPHHGDVIDAKLKKDWTEAGYTVSTLPGFGDWILTTDYLKHFSVVILSSMPKQADIYKVGGWRNAMTLGDNKKVLHDYLNAGGSVFVVPLFGGNGSGVVTSFNGFLKPYGVSLRSRQIRPGPDYRDTYAPGVVHAGHVTTEGIKDLLYPATVLRWDNAVSSMPVITSDEAWTVLASAGDKDGTYAVKGNSSVYPGRRTNNRDLLATREVGKGSLTVSGIQAFYILSHAYYDAKHKAVGESATGPIGGAVMEGEANGRPSDFKTVMDRLLRLTGGRSAKSGIGGGTDTKPAQPDVPKVHAVVDWETQKLPPTWRHRVFPNRKTWIFDVFPDPLIKGEIKYYKALVGPRTALSSGSGDTKAWRDAAKAAGYDAIMFAETFEDMTEDKFQQMHAECSKYSDDSFICLPGLNIEDSQGARYLVLGLESWLDPAWLTDDKKRIFRTNFLTLGTGSRKLISFHRPGSSPLKPKMVKHFQGFTVATYDGDGNQIDDGLEHYQWEIASDSNPAPIAVHELTKPSQCAKAAKTGYQQILPADTLFRAVDYFRHPHAHYFSCPIRYFISEGPIIDGWSIFNKDMKGHDKNRDQYRKAIGASSDVPIKEVALYDGMELYRRWTPNTKDFDTVFVGRHDTQRMFMLKVTDAKGRRAISPQSRTVVRNYRLRCGDRQNWLGKQPKWCIYQGWRQVYGNFNLSHKGPKPEFKQVQAPIFDYPYYSNHVIMTDIDGSHVFAPDIGCKPQQAYGDGAPTLKVVPRGPTENHVRTIYVHPEKRKDLGIILVETTLRATEEIAPAVNGPIYPGIRVKGKSKTPLILPEQEPQGLPKDVIDVPVGTWVGNYIVLTPELKLKGNSLGFPAPTDVKTLPKGKEWTIRYLQVQGRTFYWRSKAKEKPVEPRRELLLTQMGFRGDAPYSFKLTRGEQESLGYIARFKANRGGIAGRLENPTNEALQFVVPLQIEGVNRLSQAALWRSDSKYLEWFGAYDDVGYVNINADKTVEFYAGNVVECDARLGVSVVKWDADHAEFNVHNPTDAPIATEIATVPEIKGYKALQSKLTVPAGATVLAK